MSLELNTSKARTLIGLIMGTVLFAACGSSTQGKLTSTGSFESSIVNGQPVQAISPEAASTVALYFPVPSRAASDRVFYASHRPTKPKKDTKILILPNQPNQVNQPDRAPSQTSALALSSVLT